MKFLLRASILAAMCCSLVILGTGCEEIPDSQNGEETTTAGATATTTANTAVSGPTNTGAAGGNNNAVSELVVSGPTDPIELVNDDETVSITLDGAVGAVTWRVSDDTRGELVEGTASAQGVAYRRISSGDNVVTARDARDRTVNLVIKQP